MKQDERRQAIKQERERLIQDLEALYLAAFDRLGTLEGEVGRSEGGSTHSNDPQLKIGRPRAAAQRNRKALNHHPSCGRSGMSWLEQLERELDQRLSGFLRNNPLQDQLFQEQHSRDRAQSLQRQRQQLQEEAELQRQQLLKLAEDVRAWRQRSQKAREANASDLANRADQHLNGLMEQGRQLWNDLDDLGRRFNEVEQQLLELKTQQKTPSGSDLEKDWALFEAEQELRELRKNAGL